MCCFIIKIQLKIVCESCFTKSWENEVIIFINIKQSLFGDVFSNPMVKGIDQNANILTVVLNYLRN